MNLGKRLIWIRENLELSTREVYEPVGIPQYRYYRREWGDSTSDYSEIINIAKYLDGLWQDKYLNFENFPVYNKRKIYMITPLFLMVGDDYILDQMIREMGIIKNNYESKLKELRGNAWGT